MTTACKLPFQYWPIKVSWHTCSFVFMNDRTLQTILWSQTCLHTLADRIITQTIFTAQFTSGLFPHLGKTPGFHVWHLPQLFVYHWLSFNQFLSLQAQPVWATMISSPRALASGGGLSVALGAPWHLSNIGAVSCHLHNPVRTLLPHQSKGLGWSRDVPQQCCLSSGCNWEGHSGGQSIWPFHNVGKPLSSQGLYHGGSSQTTDCTNLHWAWLALCLSVA